MKIQIRKKSIFTNIKSGSYYVAVGLVALMGSTTGAVAQDWRFDPIFKLGYEIDDNAALSIRTDEEVEIAGYQADVTARVDYLTDTTIFSLIPRVRVRRYDVSEFDSTDSFLKMNYSHKTPAHTFAFRARYELQAVRTAERAGTDLDSVDLDDLSSDDTGLVTLEGDRTKVTLRPAWTYRMSGKSSMTLSLDLKDVTYEDVFLDILTPYTDDKLNLSFSRALSNRTSGVIALTGRNVENDDERFEFESFNAQVGIEHAVSEKTELRAMVGAEDIDFVSDSVEDSTEFVADFSVIRQLETINVLARFRRHVSANGTSIPNLRDSFDLIFNRRLSDKITASVGARAYQTEAITGSSIRGREYIELSGKVGWFFTPTFYGELKLTHTINDRGSLLAESADSNRINIWLTYRPNSPDRS